MERAPQAPPAAAPAEPSSPHAPTWPAAQQLLRRLTRRTRHMSLRPHKRQLVGLPAGQSILPGNRIKIEYCQATSSLCNKRFKFRSLETEKIWKHERELRTFPPCRRCARTGVDHGPRRLRPNGVHFPEACIVKGLDRRSRNKQTPFLSAKFHSFWEARRNLCLADIIDHIL
jgi:hypothetical protein